MIDRTDLKDVTGAAGLTPQLVNSLILILIGAALGLFWHDAVQAAARVIERLT